MNNIPDVVYAASIDNHRLHIRLSDGREGCFDVAPFWHLPSLRELQNVNYFCRVGLLHGAVTWPHEQDISPDTIAAHLQPLTSHLN